MLKRPEKSSPVPILTFLNLPKSNKLTEPEQGIDLISPAKSSIKLSPRSGSWYYPEMFQMEDYMGIADPDSKTTNKTAQIKSSCGQSSFAKKLSYESIKVETSNSTEPKKSPMR